MLMEFMRKEKGYISIFLCIVLLPMVTYATMIVDASRLQMSRVQLQTAGDLAMNAALSEYEQRLEDMYGLFATAKSKEELKPAVERYFKETIESSLSPKTADEKAYVQELASQLKDLVFSGNVDEDSLSDFVEMKLNDFEYHGIPESRVSNPMVMKSQIIDYMKYKGPLSLATNLMEKLNFLGDSENQIQAIEEKVSYTQKVAELKEPLDKAWAKLEEYEQKRDEYDAKQYHTDSGKLALYDCIKNNMDLYNKMTILSMFQNRYEALRNLAMNGDLETNHQWGESLAEQLLKKENQTTIFNFADATDDLATDITVLTSIEDTVTANFFNTEKLNGTNNYENTIYENMYGTFGFKKNDTVLEITMEESNSLDGSYTPTDNKVAEWKKAFDVLLTGMQTEPISQTVEEFTANIGSFYNEQTMFLQHHHELMNRRAMFEYYSGLQKRYSAIVEKHKDELETISHSIPEEKLPDNISIDEDASYTTRNEVAAYIFEYGKLPSNFVTISVAENAGWERSKNLWAFDALQGKSIGGDNFENKEKILPQGVSYYECDINYNGGKRKDYHERLVFTTDYTIIYYTDDHYADGSFVQLLKPDAELSPAPVITKEEAEHVLNLNLDLKKVESTWKSNPKYVEYSSFLNKIFHKTTSNNCYYSTGKQLNTGLKDDFSEFYNAVVELLYIVGGSGNTPNNDTLLYWLANLHTKVGEVDTQARQWENQVEKVKDDSVKAEMMSDQKSSTEMIDEKDEQALYAIINELWSGFKAEDEKITSQHEGLKGLIKDILSVKFLNINLCLSKKNYDYFLNNSYFMTTNQLVIDKDTLSLDPMIQPSSDVIIGNYKETIITEDRATADKPINVTFGTFYKDGTLTNNLQYLRKIDGKLDPDAVKEDADEVFYYVLESNNNYKKNKDDTLNQATEDEEGKNGNSPQEMLNSINKANEKDENGENKVANTKSTSSENEKQEEKKEEQPTAGKAEEVGDAYNAVQQNNKPAEITYGTIDDKTGNIPEDMDEDKADKQAESGKKSLEAAKEILSQIKNLAKSIGQDVYLEEYFTEMFTCQTDKVADNKDKLELLNGYSVKGREVASVTEKKLNTANAWYGKEIEYILWGDSDLDKNLKKTETYIYLIRFALNAIYAFQASDITGFAGTIASATMGWCPVLIPVVKVVIILGVALAESAYDLMLLKDGKDVVILKNGNTFVCSPRGALAKVGGDLASKAIEKTGEYVESKINKAIDSIEEGAEEITNDTITKCEEAVTSYTDSLAEQVKSSIKDTFFTPFFNAAEPMVTRLNGDLSNAESLANQAVDKAWESVEASKANFNTDSEFDSIMNYFYDNYSEALKTEIKGKLTEIFQKGKDSITMKSLEDAVWNPVESKINDFSQNYLNAEINKISNDMKLELNGIYKEGAKNLKSNMHNLIEKKSQEFSKKASDKISNTVAKHVTGTPTINKSGGSNITLNYKEFCKIFMFLKLASDFNSTDRPSETVSLMRAAALIQANVRYSYDKNQNHDFNITEAYTIVNVSAVVEMGTLFPWTASVNTDDNGNAELEADFSEIGKKTVKINYSGICGY